MILCQNLGGYRILCPLRSAYLSARYGMDYFGLVVHNQTRSVYSTYTRRYKGIDGYVGSKTRKLSFNAGRTHVPSYLEFIEQKKTKKAGHVT